MSDRPATALGPRTFVAVTVVFAAAYGSAAVIRHRNLNSRMFDLALQHQVVWNTSQGRWFESSVEVANYLGDHVSLIVLPVAAIYRLLPATETLLILQVLALAAAAVLLYFIARRVTQDQTAAFLIGLAFLLHPACALQSINDFHFTVLSLPFVFGAILCVLARRWWPASLLLLPALLAKEDVGFTLALFGVYAAIRLRARLFGALWAVVGIAWPIVAMLVILPHFRLSESDTWLRYAWLLSPDASTAITVTVDSLHGVLMLFVPLALIPLRSIEVLIGSITFGYCFASSTALWMANPGYQSLVPAIPFVFLALACGARKLPRLTAAHWRCTVAPCCLVLAGTEWELARTGVSNSAWLYVQLAALCVAGIGAALVGRQALMRRGWIALPVACFVAYNPFTYVAYPATASIFHHNSPVRLADIRSARELIPEDASVAVTARFAPHFSSRRILYPLSDAADCEYVVFSPRECREEHPETVAALDAGLLTDLGFVKCFERNTLQVWQKSSHFIHPDVPTYHTLDPAEADTDLGRALAAQGKIGEAIAYYEAVLTLSPENARMLARLGDVLQRAGRYDEAIERYQSALAVEPDFAEAHNNLGNALRAVGRPEEAIPHYLQALRLRGRSAEILSNLGLAYAESERTDEAVAAYREAIRLEPGLLAAHQNLSALLIRERRFGEAIEALREGLSNHPRQLAMANNLAWLLATSPDAADRNGQEAIAIAERLCEATGRRNPQALNTLAAAYAEAGRFDDAVRTASLAAQLAADHGNEQLARQVDELLIMYRARRPYHQSP